MAATAAAAATEPPRVLLKVTGEWSVELHFSLKPNTSLGKLKKTYAERTGIPVNTLCFLYNKRYVDDEATPASLEMVDGAVLEALESIRLKIVNQDRQGEEHVRVKYGAPMLAAKTEYAQRIGASVDALLMLHENRRVVDNATAASLKLADGDIIKFRERVELQIVSKDRDDTYVRMKYGAPMLSMMKKYSAHGGIDMSTLVLTYKGRHIKPEDTPNSLQIEVDDIVEAAVENTHA